MSHKKEMAEDVLAKLCGNFFTEYGNTKSSLMTVTKVSMSRDRKNATIYFTTFPEGKEKAALDFAKRNRSEFRDYIKDNSLLSRIPFIDFAIDYGERNRQNIDEISSKI